MTSEFNASIKIHPTAIVEDGAEIASGVEIGAFTIVRKGVRIGENSVVGSFCELGIPTKLSKSDFLEIGQNSNIRSHSVFYLGSSFGNDLTTGHHVTIRENTLAGTNFRVGTLSDIQGDCEIGNYVRFHSNVHIGKGSIVKDFVWIYPYVVLTNDPHPPSETCLGVTVGKYSVIATMTTVLPGIKIGEGSLVGAHSLVNREVPANTISAGVPARTIGPIDKIKMGADQVESAYPWRKHFHRDYPEEIVRTWKNEIYE